jgi:predicted TIM-barrel fold metal-dependent hydrolase
VANVESLTQDAILVMKSSTFASFVRAVSSRCSQKRDGGRTNGWITIMINSHKPYKFSRRDFGCVAGAAAASWVTHRATPAGEKQIPGWIDAHVHVWNPDTDKYPLGPGFQKSDMQPPSFTADELFSHCRPAGVKRIVLIQMSFYEFDHRYMNEVMSAHPGVFAGVALVDHRADNLDSRIDQLASQGIRGFRLHSRGDAKGWVEDAGMARLWRKAGREGLAVCPLINPSDIRYVDALCKKFPDTTVVVDHFARVGISGRIDPQPLGNLCRLARFSNTHVKTSAFYALGQKKPPYDDLAPMIRQVVDAFGPQRLMWGSDCPFQVQGEHSYGASIALIRDRLNFLSESDKRRILRGTAEKVFFR